ncbi:short-chain dehydrogenase [Carnobacterium divergens]|uniref:SDR family oxidoreductase n=1 Tax=Carnobacterium divergens TaxID=2748 RepID=UPI0010716F61|nr:SDR family oxidoreductase [Carnobacterium divergens]TFJ44233.1 short-chain dehydrogenase [Carnobacterium divergens]TFJ50871.1 short-chain dehydrogenase [Carnobacterium divergens]
MKNVLLIGSAGSLGQAYMKKYENKYHFIGIDKRSIAENFRSEGFQEWVVDVTNMKQVRLVKTELEKQQISIDNFVFSMGTNPLQSFYTISEETWDETFSVNLKSIVFIIKEFYSLMADNVSIVLIGSQNGVVGHEERIDYGSSKAAVIQLAKNLTIDFERDPEKDIKVNVVSPSYILNENNEKYLTETIQGKKLLKKIPLKKFVSLEDVISTMDFLLSEKSKAIRGQNIIVDYGYTIV